MALVILLPSGWHWSFSDVRIPTGMRQPQNSFNRRRGVPRTGPCPLRSAGRPVRKRIHPWMGVMGCMGFMIPIGVSERGWRCGCRANGYRRSFGSLRRSDRPMWLRWADVACVTRFGLRGGEAYVPSSLFNSMRISAIVTQPPQNRQVGNSSIPDLSASVAHHVILTLAARARRETSPESTAWVPTEKSCSPELNQWPSPRPTQKRGSLSSAQWKPSA